MYIKYLPRDVKTARPQSTNLGTFVADQVGGPYLTDQHKRWAMELVANGEFIQADSKGEPVTGNTIATAANPAPSKPAKPAKPRGKKAPKA